MSDQNPNPIRDAGRSSDSDTTPKAKAASGAFTPEDSALLEGVRIADQDAMAAIFDRYSRIVYSVAFRILKDSGHAEDVMQENFSAGVAPAEFVRGRTRVSGSLARCIGAKQVH